MVKFKQFSKKHFDYELKSVLIRNRAGFVREIEHGQSWEHIYEISTKNPSVKILMFTSVDKRTGKTRDNGTDRVRLVMQWTNRKGEKSYKRLARHNRLQTLFGNVERTIVDAKVFDLKLSEFSKELPF